MSEFTVLKCDHRGHVTYRYSGQIVARGASWVCIRAIFEAADRDLGYVTMNRGDVFTEWYYADRWYNVFRIQDGQTGTLKGWYCNITRPAQISDENAAAEDLALDVFVRLDRTLLVLDEDEYQALHLPAHEQESVQAALAEIRRLAAERSTPFED